LAEQNSPQRIELIMARPETEAHVRPEGPAWPVDHKASGETRITRAPGQTPPCRWCDADHPRAFTADRLESRAHHRETGYPDPVALQRIPPVLGLDVEGARATTPTGGSS